MKLLTKFNLILLLLFGAGGLIISQVISSFLISNARREVLQEAELMMASAKSVRDYTSSDLGALTRAEPATQEEVPGGDSAGFRSDQYFQQAEAEVSRLHVPRSHVEPDKSGASRRRLGRRRHWISAGPPRTEAGYGRAGDAGWSFDVPGNADHGGSAVPGVSQSVPPWLRPP